MTGRTRRMGTRWELWITVAFFCIALTVVGLFFVNQRTSKTLARQQVLSHANSTRIAASADSAYRECLASIPQLHRINAFVHGVQDLHHALVENSVANHKATPPGTAMYRQQIQNIARLRRTVSEVSSVTFPVPTKEECAARRVQILRTAEAP